MPVEDRSPTLLPLSRVPEGPESNPVSSAVSSGVAIRQLPQLDTLFPVLLDKIPTAVVVVDGEFSIILANAAARLLFAVRTPSLNGYALTRYLCRERLEQARSRLMNGAGPQNYLERLRLTEEERDVEISVDLVEDRGAHFLCLSLFDRTDFIRERAEWSTQSGATSPGSHLERAHHLEALGHLTGTFAHDFNNMLSVILGSLEAAERRLRRSEQPLEDVQRALSATERSIEATSQILHYVRRRGGKPELLCPVAILEGLRGLIERAIGEEIELRFLTRPTGSIEAPAGQVETAVLNLVINARDAVEQGGRIEIALRSEEIEQRRAPTLNVPPGRYVFLSVTDNGCGMSEATRARAFEPFFTTKPEGRGTGLGLSSVCGIVRGLGGTVVIDSALGQGTKIELLFPEVPFAVDA